MYLDCGPVATQLLASVKIHRTTNQEVWVSQSLGDVGHQPMRVRGAESMNRAQMICEYSRKTDYRISLGEAAHLSPRGEGNI